MLVDAGWDAEKLLGLRLMFDETVSETVSKKEGELTRVNDPGDACCACDG